jgi:hypothetical protein
VAKYAVNLTYRLRDLTREPDSTLHDAFPTDTLWGRFVLWLLKRAFQGPLSPQLKNVLPILKVLVSDPANYRVLETTFRYIFGVEDGPFPPDVQQELTDTFGYRTMENAMSWLQQEKQQSRQEGLQEGLQKGLQKGRQEGWRDGRQDGLQKGLQKGEKQLLKRQLTKRFGVLPPDIDDRLRALTTQQLEAAGERIFDAASVDDVLGDVH